MRLESRFLIILLSFIAFTVNAQEKENYKSVNGFLFGFTLGSFNKNFIGSEYNTTVVGGGLTFGYKNIKGINNKFSRSYEVIYTSKGGGFSGNNPDVQSHNISNGSTSSAKNYDTFSFQYFELPLILYWHPNKNYIDHRSEASKAKNIKLGVGFAPAINVGATNRYNVYIADEPVPGPINLPVSVTEKQIKRSFNNANGFVGNLVLDFHAGVRHGLHSTMFLNVRYNYMLSSVFIEEHPKVKLHSFSIGLGWLF